MTQTPRPHTFLATAAPLLAGALSIAALLPAPALGQSALEEAAAMISGGSTRLALRYRLEDVSQDNTLRDAVASTLRSRLSFQSSVDQPLSLALEVDNVLGIGPNHHDSFALDRYRARYAVIADPVGTEVNVAALTRTLGTGRSLSLGRQRLNHGAQRFLGSVGWRQNEQTFDALSYRQTSDTLSVDYSYLWNVNRVFKGSRPSAQPGDLDSDSHALLLTRKTPWGSVSGFVYALDFANARPQSSLTGGISVSGTLAPLNLSATYAWQSDHAANPLDYAADYLQLEASGKLGAMTLLAGHERLGSDGGRTAFGTPLATLHRYQGFADLFLNTPANGIADTYLSLSGALHGVALAVSLHDYAAARGNADYGHEFNLAASHAFSPRLSVEAKYAAYRSDGFAVDTDKLWLSLMLAL